MKVIKMIILSMLLSGCANMPRFNPTPASAALMGFGAQMMRDSAPRPMYVPPAPAHIYQQPTTPQAYQPRHQTLPMNPPLQIPIYR